MYHTVRTKVYIPYVLSIPSGRTQMDLGTDHGVYFFFFYGVASPKSELRETFYERMAQVILVLCVCHCPALRSRHDYDDNVHTFTSIYS